MKNIWHYIIHRFYLCIGSVTLPWGRGLCTMCDHCRATSYLSHPITGCTLTRLTGAGQSPFCSLAITVSHVARERWLEMFWILLIGSRYRSALGFVKQNYWTGVTKASQGTLPGKPPEALTAEIDCFSRSVLAYGHTTTPSHPPTPPPTPIHLCW